MNKLKFKAIVMIGSIFFIGNAMNEARSLLNLNGR